MAVIVLFSESDAGGYTTSSLQADALPEPCICQHSCHVFAIRDVVSAAKRPHPYLGPQVVVSCIWVKGGLIMGLSAAVPAYVTMQWGSVAALRGSCVQVFQVQHSVHAPSLPGALPSLLLPRASQSFARQNSCQTMHRPLQGSQTLKSSSGFASFVFLLLQSVVSRIWAQLVCCHPLIASCALIDRPRQGARSTAGAGITREQASRGPLHEAQPQI